MKRMNFSRWFMLPLLCLLLLGCDSGSQNIGSVEEAGAVFEVEEEKAITDPTIEPVIESVAEATEEPTAEPTPELTPEPIIEPTPEPTPEPIIEPTPEPAIKVASEPTSVPVQESVAPAAGENEAAVAAEPAEIKETQVAPPENNPTNPTVAATGVYAVNAKNGKIHIVGKCPATGNGEHAMDCPVYFDTYEEAEAYSISIKPKQDKRNCGNCW